MSIKVKKKKKVCQYTINCVSSEIKETISKLLTRVSQSIMNDLEIVFLVIRISRKGFISPAKET